MKPGILTYWLAFWAFSCPKVFLSIYFNKAELDSLVQLNLYPESSLFNNHFFSFLIEDWNLPVTTHEV